MKWTRFIPLGVGVIVAMTAVYVSAVPVADREAGGAVYGGMTWYRSTYYSYGCDVSGGCLYCRGVTWDYCTHFSGYGAPCYGGAITILLHASSGYKRPAISPPDQPCYGSDFCVTLRTIEACKEY